MYVVNLTMRFMWFLLIFQTICYLSTFASNDEHSFRYSTDTTDVDGRYLQFLPMNNQPTSRRKRNDDYSSIEDSAKLSNDTELSNATHIKIDYKYYQLYYYSPDKAKFSQYWIDIPTLLNSSSNGRKTVKGELKHKQLANAYRRAVSQKLSFKFPFYGHETESITIATGGFIYAGDQFHSWLAAIQYIAPLMANFDTNSSYNSKVLYADTGEYFVAEWHQVFLRHQNEAGNFTFQVSLHKNGDIWFVYKNIPVEMKMINDLHHPRKVGLSDAYLYTHTIITLSRRVIYEYHKVEVDFDFVQSKAVVVLKAQPVCIMFKDCRSCMDANLASFNCSWCELSGNNNHNQQPSSLFDQTSSLDQTPTFASTSFCSDDEGLNRKRQEWLDNECHKDTNNVYCSTMPSSQSSLQETSSRSSVSIESSTLSSNKTVTATVSGGNEVKHTERLSTFSSHSIGLHKSDIHRSTSKPSSKILTDRITIDNNGMSRGAILLLILFLSLLFSSTVWIVYAYKNPTTPSGQFLIRNRPALWRWPVSHGDVRYTASLVHM